MIEVTLTDLKRILDEFNREFPRPHMPPIAICEPVDLASGYLKKLPGTSSAGVYAIFSNEDVLVYIGKSSLGSKIVNRLRAHFDANGQPSGTKVWHGNAKRVATIPMPSGRDFESSSIEEYLIWKCRLDGNKRGYKRGVAGRAILLDAVRQLKGPE